MKARASLLIIFSLMIKLLAYSQYELPYGFEKTYGTLTLDSIGEQIDNPWAGGLNACQFGEIDLDNDGIRDLVVFDRNGNRTLTYKNLGAPDEMSFQFQPGLAEKLPHFDDWVIFADYNMDGLNDIFTYSKGFAGVKVYRNTGIQPDLFELIVFPYLKSDYGSGYVNILVTYADYPAIYDIDKDGDLDLLTFWGLGSFVEYHQNQSMEKYGHADSLDFKKVENCWGRFAESEESNVIYLDTCYRKNERSSDIAFSLDPAQGENGGADDDRHTGSTFMIFDENGDGLDDLLLGDVDYSSPALLINGGTPEEAIMVSHTFVFPEYNSPIDLLSFPVMKYLDIDNDDKHDLIVSTFDPRLVKSKNLDNIWFYKNTGQQNQPVFQLQQKNLFQEDMLDFGAGSIPVFFDHNADGLTDIVVSNFGYFDSAYYGPGSFLNCKYRSQLALLENVGTHQNPAFQLMDENYVNLPSYFSATDPLFAACPTFGDIDGDGDKDMLLGNAEGTIHLFENIAMAGQDADFILSEYFFQGIDAGYYSTPQLFDLDEDGLQDLVTGKRNGTISYFKNTGTSTSPIFTLITDSLGKVDVRNPNLSVYGYCIPHFFKNDNGEIQLFAGSEFGEIYYYTGINNNLDGAFKLVMKNYLWIDEGLRSAVAVEKLNDDEFPDMIVGNYSGGLSYFKGTTAPPAGFDDQEISGNLILFPNPAGNFLHIQSSHPIDSKAFTITIFDICGRLADGVENFQIMNSLDISQLKPGIYFVKVSEISGTPDKKPITLKFVKK
jgi:hypothetical protein